MSTTSLDAPADRRPPRHRRPAAADRNGRLVLPYLFLGVLVVYFLIPIWWLFVASTKNAAGLFDGTNGALWFDQTFALFPNLEGPVHLQRRHLPALDRQLAVLRRRRWRRRHRAGGAGRLRLRQVPLPRPAADASVLLGSVMVPLTALVIPTFILFSNINLTDTVWAVILPSLLNPFGVYLMQVYTADAVPDELLDAARVDGAGEFKTFLRVALAAAAARRRHRLLLSIVGTWNNYFLPLAMLANTKLFPITVGLGLWQGQASGNNSGGANPLGPDHHRFAGVGHPARHRVPVPAEVLAGRALRRAPSSSPRPPPCHFTLERRTMPSAHLTLDPHFTIGTVHRRLFGSFVEHLGRCVYDRDLRAGPSDARTTTASAPTCSTWSASSASPTIRYPGGNFVSGFRWEDAIGPKQNRPARLDLAWHSTESNEVGIDEFARWLEKAGSELMYAVNLGTRGVQEALDVLEYANIRSGTKLSDARVKNGRVEPHADQDVVPRQRDGRPVAARPPQRRRLRQARVADGQGHAAARPRRSSWWSAAAPVRRCPPSGPGSTRCCSTPTRTSTTSPATPTTRSSTATRAASWPRRSTWTTSSSRWWPPPTPSGPSCARRSGSTSPSTSGTSGTSTRYREVEQDHRHRAAGRPPPGCSRTATRCWTPWWSATCSSRCSSTPTGSPSASLAQLVNVIAPIMTEPGGGAWRQTTFFPFAMTSRLAVGSALEVKLDLGHLRHRRLRRGPPGRRRGHPRRRDRSDGRSSWSTAAWTRPPASPSTSASWATVSILETHTLADDDIYATNTLTDQDRVSVAPNRPPGSTTAGSPSSSRPCPGPPLPSADRLGGPVLVVALRAPSTSKCALSLSKGLRQAQATERQAQATPNQ